MFSSFKSDGERKTTVEGERERGGGGDIQIEEETGRHTETDR